MHYISTRRTNLHSNCLPLFIDFVCTALQLRPHLGDLMPAQKRQSDSSTPPPSPSPSPSPPPDAEKSDDSQLGTENHIDEQPVNASGACLALSICSRQRTCIVFATLNSSCIQHFCFRFLIVSYFVDLPRFFDSQIPTAVLTPAAEKKTSNVSVSLSACGFIHVRTQSRMNTERTCLYGITLLPCGFERCLIR